VGEAASAVALTHDRLTWQSMRRHTMSSTSRITDQTANADHMSTVMRAAAHPIRVRVLAALAQREMSPVELSRTLGRPDWSLGVIAYHVRLLAAHGLIELESTIQRRGAIEHRYVATPEGRALSAAVARLARRGATSPAAAPR
jgi:DNA-binding transcriptional ArsR family regulator